MNAETHVQHLVRPLKPSLYFAHIDNESKDVVQGPSCRSISPSSNDNHTRKYKLAQLCIRKQQKRALKEMKEHLGSSMMLTELNRSLLGGISKSSSDLSCAADDMQDYFRWDAARSGPESTSSRRRSSIDERDDDNVDGDVMFVNQSSIASIENDLKRFEILWQAR